MSGAASRMVPEGVLGKIAYQFFKRGHDTATIARKLGHSEANVVAAIDEERASRHAASNGVRV